MHTKCIDWATAVWVALMGLLFLVPVSGALLGSDMLAYIGVELWPIGNYVYMVVLVVSLTAIAVAAVRRISRK